MIVLCLFSALFPSATRFIVRSVIGRIHGTPNTGKIIAKAVAVSVAIIKTSLNFLLLFSCDFDSSINGFSFLKLDFVSLFEFSGASSISYLGGSKLGTNFCCLKLLEKD